MAMTVLVIGGSSQIGHFLLPRLDAAGYDWLAVSRRPPVGDIRWLAGSLPAAMPELPPLEAVVSVGPIGALVSWLSAVRLPGTPHVIATSSMSAESKRESLVPEEREISRHLREAETSLRTLCASRGMPWTLFRPTLIYGAGLDKSLSPMVAKAARRRVFPLLAGRGYRQPVHADDIAAAIVAALGTLPARGHLFPIGGGERLRAADMFRRTWRSAGSFSLPAPVPRLVLDIAALASAAVRGPIHRLDSDLVADNTDLEQILGIHPRPFRPGPDAWRAPR